jgi:hypothetical protein
VGLSGDTANGTLTATWADATNTTMLVIGDVISAHEARSFAVWLSGKASGGIDAHDRVVMFGRLVSWP